MNVLTTVIVAAVSALVFFVIGAVVGSVIRKNRDAKTLGDANTEATKILNDAIARAEETKRDTLDKAKKEANRLKTTAANEAGRVKNEADKEVRKLRSDADREIRERRNEVQKQEDRLNQREERLDKRADTIEAKTESLNEKLKKADDKLLEIDSIKKSQFDMLEKISGLSQSDARSQLLKSLDEELNVEKSKKVLEYKDKLKSESDDIARDILSTAIQRCAADQVAEITVSVIPLPSEDMKARLIGREGRNIRSIEQLTGVELIIDDTPEAVTISCFDPVRREIARVTIEHLMKDGRIHPAKIEEFFRRATNEVNTTIKQTGEKAVLDADCGTLHPELVKLLGKLKYRTSYGQNVLQHSLEVSYISGLMAAELGLNEKLARRAGLLHDIGKALDHEMEGSHVALGVEAAKRYKENETVVNAIAAHHGDTECKTAIACLVQAADAVSAARPGARRENIENYIKRLEKLEEISKSYAGVESAYALQAGREVRVMVSPDEVSDDKMPYIAHQIADQIENELEYPGQIKVNIIRESRAEDIAK